MKNKIRFRNWVRLGCCRFCNVFMSRVIYFRDTQAPVMWAKFRVEDFYATVGTNRLGKWISIKPNDKDNQKADLGQEEVRKVL